MSEDNTEGVDTFQRVTVTDGGYGGVDGKTKIWKVEQVCPIIDGKIRIVTDLFGAEVFFDVEVKQIKGRGTADAEKLRGKALRDEHTQILTLVMKQNVDELTANEIKDLVIQESPDKDRNHIQRSISELRRLDCFVYDGKLLKLNKLIIQAYLESGKFVKPQESEE